MYSLGVVGVLVGVVASRVAVAITVDVNGLLVLLVLLQGLGIMSESCGARRCDEWQHLLVKLAGCGARRVRWCAAFHSL